MYDIREPEDLLSDLLGLWGTQKSRLKLEREVLDFVLRHGLLWHGPEQVGSGDCREPLKKVLESSLKIGEAALLHARLREAVESGSTAPLKNFQPVVNWEDFLEKASDDNEYLSQASAWLAELVNLGMRGSQRLTTAACTLTQSESDRSPVAGPGVFVFMVGPPTLEAAAYVHFANNIEAQIEMNECIGCGRPFQPKSGKQKYCSESCANTNRWRRWKEKQTNPA